MISLNRENRLVDPIGRRERVEVLGIDDERVGAVVEQGEDEGEIAVLLHIGSHNERNAFGLIAFQNGAIVCQFGDPVDVLHTTVLGMDVLHRIHGNGSVEGSDGDCEQTVIGS